MTCLLPVEPFVGKPTNPEPPLPTPSLWSSYTPPCRPLLPCPDHPGPIPHNSGLSLYLTTTEIIQTSQSEARLPCLIPSQGNRNKGSHPCVSLSHEQPWCFLGGPPWPEVSPTPAWRVTHIFSMAVVSDLPHHTWIRIKPML